VLSLFFGIASIYAYAFYAEKNKISRYLLCLILFMLSLMSKPILVTLPFALLLLDYWPLGRWQIAFSSTKDKKHKMAWRILWEKIPFLILTIAACIAAIWAHHKGGSVSSEAVFPVIQRAANAIVSLAVYLGKIIWPHDLVIYYPYNFSLPVWKILISGAVAIAISIIVLRNTRKMKFLFVGWFWYLGTLMPVIGLMQVGSQAMADRYTYLPSIGIAIMLAWGIPCVIKNKEIRKKFLLPSGIFVIAILAVLTWHQCGYWKNSLTLFSHALKVTENNYIAHNHLANALVKARKFDRAFYHYNKAIQINPLYAHAYYNRGIANYISGRKQLALADFEKTIRLMPKIPKSASAYHNIGIIYAELGQYQRAIDYYHEAIELQPDYASAYNNRALVYFKIGEKNAGCQDVQKACELRSCATLQSTISNGMCR
ncbi:MAG: tetratricopeptide repeat protein, partial [Smithella sp.]